jgi:hypothetical protein
VPLPLYGSALVGNAQKRFTIRRPINMGMLSDNYYMTLDDNVVSVSAKVTLNANPLIFGGGGAVYELKINGEVVDSHEHKMIPKSGTLYAILEQGSKKISIRVEIVLGWFMTKYKMFVDEAEVVLTKTSESKLKALWHKRAIST